MPSTDPQSYKPPLLSIERVVVLFTPVFAAASAWLVGLVATNAPWVPRPNTTTLTGVEIAAVVGAVAVVIKWLHGRQLPAIKDSFNTVDAVVHRVVEELSKVGMTPQLEAAIAAEVGKLATQLHIPDAQQIVDQVVSQIQQRISGAPPPPLPGTGPGTSAPVA